MLKIMVAYDLKMVVKFNIKCVQHILILKFEGFVAHFCKFIATVVVIVDGF